MLIIMCVNWMQNNNGFLADLGGNNTKKKQVLEQQFAATCVSELMFRFWTLYLMMLMFKINLERALFFYFKWIDN